MISSYENVLISEIKTLSERVWENRIAAPQIELWLENFTGKAFDVREERLHALHLLRNFNFFGVQEIRTLLVSMYRDIFKYGVIQTIRREENMSRDANLIQAKYGMQLANTRFMAMGNPSESGAHLLYYFRQENSLSKNLFATAHDLFDGPITDTSTRLNPAELQRVIFIDDVLGSGQQASEYSRSIIADLRRVAHRNNQQIQICYYVLFAKPEGLNRLRQLDFDQVSAVHELDSSQMAFDDRSRVYANANDPYLLSDGLKLATTYGKLVLPQHPLGYLNGQMLLGLSYNVPDNTLPIIWRDLPANEWNAIFPRHMKK